MKYSLDLFHLIHSLSKTEKGYFKKFASLHTIGKENKYVTLFDIIEKQKTYDEKKIIATIGLNKKSKNFPVLKSYLYNLILKSLRLYHSQKSVELELKELSEYIEILSGKGLYGQCNKLINKGIELAKKHELFLPLTEFIMLKLDIMHMQLYFGNNAEEVKQGFENIFSSLRKYQKIISYKQLIAKGIVERKAVGFVRKEGELGILDEISQHELFKNIENADSYKAITHFHIWHCLYAFSKHDYETAYLHSKKLVGHMDANPWQKKAKPENYITALYNLLGTQIEIPRFVEAMQTLEKLKEVKTESKSVQKWLFYTTNTIELNINIQLGEFDKGLKLVHAIESSFKDVHTHTHKEQEIIFFFNIGIIYFGSENYSKANYYFNKIIHESSLDLRNDIHCFARIMSLIVHTEMGNNDLLEYTIKSTYRFLYKRKKLYKFETLILSFIKKNMFSKQTTEKQLHKGFTELIHEIDTLKNDPFEKKALHYFDFISWLESKIFKKKFAAIVKEKAPAKLRT